MSEQQEETEREDLDDDEVEQQEAELLPDREEMAFIDFDGGLSPPAP